MEGENGDIIRKYIQQVWQAGNYRVIDEQLAPDFEFYVSITNEVKDKYWYSRFVPTMRQPFVNIKVEVISLVEGGNDVAVYFRMSGKQVDKAFGIDSQGKQTIIDIMSIFELEDGLIKRCRSVTDLAGLKAKLK